MHCRCTKGPHVHIPYIHMSILSMHHTSSDSCRHQHEYAELNVCPDPWSLIPDPSCLYSHWLLLLRFHFRFDFPLSSFSTFERSERSSRLRCRRYLEVIENFSVAYENVSLETIGYDRIIKPAKQFSPWSLGGISCTIKCIWLGILGNFGQNMHLIQSTDAGSQIVNNLQIQVHCSIVVRHEMPHFKGCDKLGSMDPTCNMHWPRELRPSLLNDTKMNLWWQRRRVPKSQFDTHMVCPNH